MATASILPTSRRPASAWPGCEERARLIGGRSLHRHRPRRHPRRRSPCPLPHEEGADMAPIRVAIVDDHALVREGLRLILDAQQRHRRGGRGSDHAGALSLAAQRRPHIMLVDLTLGDADGVALVRDLRARYPAHPGDRRDHAPPRGDGPAGIPGRGGGLHRQGRGQRGAGRGHPGRGQEPALRPPAGRIGGRGRLAALASPVGSAQPARGGGAAPDDGRADRRRGRARRWASAPTPCGATWPTWAPSSASTAAWP